MSEESKTTNRDLKASRRRDKPQLSCTLCRKRKLKCDRSHPCSTCYKKGLSCVYVKPSSNVSKEEEVDDSSKNIQDRIDQLERLVSTLANRLRTERKRNTTDEDHVNTRFNNMTNSLTISNGPRMYISDSTGEVEYTDGDHWTAIMDSVSEIKKYVYNIDGMNERQSNSSEAPIAERLGLLSAFCRPFTKQELLSSIPPKKIADKLVAEYFNNIAVTRVFLHRSTFLKEYKQFWITPDSTPVTWLAILYSILCIAILYQTENDRGGFISDAKTRVLYYREKIIQCLHFDNYTRCVPYTLEALILYLNIEYVNTEDTRTASWILVGVIVRLAMRMGYHREPSHFPNVSIFAGEMRRRTWAFIKQLDMLVSVEIGLPRIVSDSQCDTQDPQNFLDDDLSEDMTVLPLVRSLSVNTPVLYLISKNKILQISAKISETLSSGQETDYSEIMRLDRLLETTYNQIPHVLHMKSIADSVMDCSAVIMHRIYIALSFYSARCTLNRRYMNTTLRDQQYSYSFLKTIESALEILKMQAILNEEVKEGGRLYYIRWKIVSMVKSTFLLAVSILCLEISTYSLGPSNTQNLGPEYTNIYDRIAEALSKSYNIWMETIESSQESKRAATAIRVALSKTSCAIPSDELSGSVDGFMLETTEELLCLEGMLFSTQ
ncbi:fungal-specific transcription factor domain-containing protein [Dipodascopsis uninucleata]